MQEGLGPLGGLSTSQGIVLDHHRVPDSDLLPFLLGPEAAACGLGSPSHLCHRYVQHHRRVRYRHLE